MKNKPTYICKDDDKLVSVKEYKMDQFDFVDMILEKAKYTYPNGTFPGVYTVVHNNKAYEADDPKDLVAKVKADMEEK